MTLLVFLHTIRITKFLSFFAIGISRVFPLKKRYVNIINCIEKNYCISLYNIFFCGCDARLWLLSAILYNTSVLLIYYIYLNTKRYINYFKWYYVFMHLFHQPLLFFVGWFYFYPRLLILDLYPNSIRLVGYGLRFMIRISKFDLNLLGR